MYIKTWTWCVSSRSDSSERWNKKFHSLTHALSSNVWGSCYPYVQLDTWTAYDLLSGIRTQLVEGLRHAVRVTWRLPLPCLGTVPHECSSLATWRLLTCRSPRTGSFTVQTIRKRRRMTFWLSMPARMAVSLGGEPTGQTASIEPLLLLTCTSLLAAQREGPSLITFPWKGKPFWRVLWCLACWMYCIGITFACLVLFADICRVCRTGSTPGRPLFHPCLCTGSIKFIHQEWWERERERERERDSKYVVHQFSLLSLDWEVARLSLPLGIFL